MLLAWYLSHGTFNFLVSSQLWSDKVPFFRGFFFFVSISMINSFSVVLRRSGSLFPFSLCVWIVNYGEGEFSPSVLSSVARAPCWDNMANVQTSKSSAKGTGAHAHIVEMLCRYITNRVYTQYVGTHTHTHSPNAICPSSRQWHPSKQAEILFNWIIFTKKEATLCL